MPDFGQNHENWSESGPYGSVWDDTPPESIPYGLRCLPYASGTSKPHKNQKKLEIRENPGIPLFSPIPRFGSALLRIEKFNNPKQGLVGHYGTCQVV